MLVGCCRGTVGVLTAEPPAGPPAGVMAVLDWPNKPVDGASVVAGGSAAGCDTALGWKSDWDVFVGVANIEGWLKAMLPAPSPLPCDTLAVGAATPVGLAGTGVVVAAGVPLNGFGCEGDGTGGLNKLAWGS